MGCLASYCCFEDPVKILITTKRPGYTLDAAREAVVRLTVSKANTISNTTAPKKSSEASTLFTTEDGRSKPAKTPISNSVTTHVA